MEVKVSVVEQESTVAGQCCEEEHITRTIWKNSNVSSELNGTWTDPLTCDEEHSHFKHPKQLREFLCQRWRWGRRSERSGLFSINNRFYQQRNVFTHWLCLEAGMIALGKSVAGFFFLQFSCFAEYPLLKMWPIRPHPPPPPSPIVKSLLILFPEVKIKACLPKQGWSEFEPVVGKSFGRSCSDFDGWQRSLLCAPWLRC